MTARIASTYFRTYYLVDNNEAEKLCRESDRTSNISDMKLELRKGSSVSRPGSETGSERGVGGVPLAGPVHLPMALNGAHGDHVYRYSTEYPEPSFPGRAEQQRARAVRGLLAGLHAAAVAEPADAPGRAPGAAGGARRAPARVQPAGVRRPEVLGRLRQPVPEDVEREPAAPAHQPGAQRQPEHGEHRPHRGRRDALGHGAPQRAAAAALQHGRARPGGLGLANSPTSQYIVPSSHMATIKRGTLATHV